MLTPRYLDEALCLVQNETERIDGKVYVTNYRLRFEPTVLEDQASLNGGRIINVTLGSISKIEKMGHSTSDRWPVGARDDKYGLLVYCKVWRL